MNHHRKIWPNNVFSKRRKISENWLSAKRWTCVGYFGKIKNTFNSYLSVPRLERPEEIGICDVWENVKRSKVHTADTLTTIGVQHALRCHNFKVIRHQTNVLQHARTVCTKSMYIVHITHLHILMNGLSQESNVELQFTLELFFINLFSSIFSEHLKVQFK